jgi:hypothetical protein
MFLAHSFRLRDPWQCEREANGAVRWSRVFHRPTGLEDDDALWLVCSGLPAGATVVINGERLTPCATGVPPVRPAESPATSSTGGAPVPPTFPRNQFDVTLVLADANRIEIRVAPSAQPLSGRQPTADGREPFPFDVRLGVVGHS